MCDTITENARNNMEKIMNFEGELSLYDADTKDSGFSEGIPEDLHKLIDSPLLLPDDSEVSVCFSPAKYDNTPNKSWLSKKRRQEAQPELETPSKQAAISLKRLKIFGLDDDLGREHVKEAVEKSSEEEDLIGDFSKIYCLPVVTGAHPDLKTVSAKTVNDLVQGLYKEKLTSFKIIDSRYPYEYNGGHIKDSINIYTTEDCFKLLDQTKPSKSERHILIFHCEFSKERGPNMCRQLREEDRLRNGKNYPDLCYPEIYVLEGGYKSFFGQFPELCNPPTYKQMLHPEHGDDLKYFRKKSKSSNGEFRIFSRKSNKTTKRFFSDGNY